MKLKRHLRLEVWGFGYFEVRIPFLLKPHGSGKWVPPILDRFLSSRLIFRWTMIMGERGTHSDPCWIFFGGEWVWRNQFKWFLKMRVVTSKHHVKTSSSPGLFEHLTGALQFCWGISNNFVCVYIWIEFCTYFTTWHIKPFGWGCCTSLSWCFLWLYNH